MKTLLLIISAFLMCMFACKKSNTAQRNTVHTPIPFLTGRLWTLDTILINPPATYNQLTPDEQRTYNLTLDWEKTGELTFNEDGTVTAGGGNWDFGFYKWRMINNGADIEVLVGPNATKDTLFHWTANSQQFTYNRSFDAAFECTMVYR